MTSLSTYTCDICEEELKSHANLLRHHEQNQRCIKMRKQIEKRVTELVATGVEEDPDPDQVKDNDDDDDDDDDDEKDLHYQHELEEAEDLVAGSFRSGYSAFGSGEVSKALEAAKARVAAESALAADDDKSSVPAPATCTPYFYALALEFFELQSKGYYPTLKMEVAAYRKKYEEVYKAATPSQDVPVLHKEQFDNMETAIDRHEAAWNSLCCCFGSPKGQKAAKGCGGKGSTAFSPAALGKWFGQATVDELKAANFSPEVIDTIDKFRDGEKKQEAHEGAPQKSFWFFVYPKGVVKMKKPLKTPALPTKPGDFAMIQSDAMHFLYMPAKIINYKLRAMSLGKESPLHHMDRTAADVTAAGVAAKTAGT